MKKYLFIVLLLIAIGFRLSAQTDAINIKTAGLMVDFSNTVGGGALHGSAIMQVEAYLGTGTTNPKGFLMPRVTLATDINTACSCTPATGLLVYQTGGTAGIYYYDGTAWRLLVNSSTGVSWTKATTASTPAIKTDNQYVTGNVGLGDFSAGSPAAKLDIKSTQTSGTLISSGAPSAVTLAGALTGETMDLSTNYTATGFNVTGSSIALPAASNTGVATYTYKGLSVTGGASGSNGISTVNNWTGADVVNSNITQTSGTATATGFRASTGTITTGGTQSGFGVTATGVGAGNLYGFDVSAITAGAGTERAVNIGTGWDHGIYSATAGANYFAGTVGIGSGVTAPAQALEIGGNNTARIIGIKAAGTFSTAPGASSVIMFADANGDVRSIPAANNSTLTTNGTGVPSWTTGTTSSLAWLQTGNAGTSNSAYADAAAQSNNFIGTTDNIPVSIYTNSASTTAKTDVKLYTSASTGAVATAPSDIFHIRRNGTTSVNNSQSVAFALGKYGTSVNSETDLAIRLGNGGSSVPDVTVMTLRGNGNIGVGATAPLAKFDISAGADANGASDQIAIALQYRNNGGYRHFIRSRHNSGASSGNDIDFYLANGTTAGTAAGLSSVPGTGNTHVMTLENFGAGTTQEARVGIATNTPLSTLNMVQSSNGTLTNFTQALSRSGVLITTNYTANNYTPGLFWSTSDNNATKPKAGIFLQETSSGTFMHFGTSNNYGTGITNSAVIIDHGGNVGINNAPSTTFKLYVNGKFRSDGIDESSDERLKKDINPIEGALHKVLEMRGVTYNWRKDEFPERTMEDGLQYGLIAQELEKVIPELVTTDDKGWKSIEYSHLVPVLIEAIKELKAENNSLKAANIAGSAKLETLNSKFETMLIRMAALESTIETTGNKASR